MRKDVPVWGLNAGRECGADTSTRADTDTTLVKGGRVGHTSELVPNPKSVKQLGTRCEIEP